MQAVVKLNNAHRGAVTRVKLEAFRLYDLRHTFATRATEVGVDLVTLAALLGHSRVQMVMRYAHPTEEHQFNAVKKMEAHRATLRPQPIVQIV
jgi:integrase